MVAPGSSSLAFGSCNRQSKDQSFWQAVSQEVPSHFLWLGDAVYSGGNGVDKLVESYRNLTSDNYYRGFCEKTIIDGVWDDHDYGVNDGGKYVKNKTERQAIYKEFISSTANNITSLLSDQADGIYHATDIELSGMKIKVIFLDTRSNRDHHYIRSLSEFRFIPLSAFISSAIRGAYSVMGYGREYSGEMLGDAQWVWFERTLKKSQADMHIIVSSVQVMSSNPVFESWTHFPVEKKRLFDTIQKVDPANVVFLSGDVHLGEISYTPYTRSDGSENNRFVEITSSGLTHSTGGGRLTSLLAPACMWLFDKHRLTKDSFYFGRNYGTLKVSKIISSAADNTNTDTSTVNESVVNGSFGVNGDDGLDSATTGNNTKDNTAALLSSNSIMDHSQAEVISGWNVQFDIRSLEPHLIGQSVLSYPYTVVKSMKSDTTADGMMINSRIEQSSEHNTENNVSISTIYVTDFPLLPKPVRITVYGSIVLVLYVLWLLIRRILRGQEKRRIVKRD